MSTVHKYNEAKHLPLPSHLYSVKAIVAHLETCELLLSLQKETSQDIDELSKSLEASKLLAHCYIASMLLENGYARLMTEEECASASKKPVLLKTV